ncbi:unnamed protein product [Polarella glacialis]|uniref:S1 motif domain-containing protein n=1 Tax=Polarella glacialis TaxID=89957 RepID=A0A813FG70_POLGL|nr:unnamed protein product [Polarella glacialis]CAE8631167.1 unnamed protein product [Polarella glacialis]CAE8715858.1 unnamed protein product [Polarella glacialis]
MPSPQLCCARDGRLHVARLASDGAGEQQVANADNHFEFGKAYPATVISFAKYGVALDLGADRPGWMHISKISDERVERIESVLSIGDEVSVWILEVKPSEVEVTMRKLPIFSKRPLSAFKVGEIVEGTVTGTTGRAVFLDVGAVVDGYLAVNNVKKAGDSGDGNWRDMFKKGTSVKAKVQGVSNNKLSLIGL